MLLLTYVKEGDDVMSIKHAILGMLSYKNLTGYDLKKIMQNATFMPWSGNNNQIYKALLDLDNDDFVTSEVCHQESSPSKKIYTITQAGIAELKKWSQSIPEALETKKTFLVQLAWADLLNDEELEALLCRYEQEIKGQIFIEQTNSQKGFFKEGRTSRETAIWELISENTLLTYQSELEWINKAKTILLNHSETGQKDISSAAAVSEKENKQMKYQIIEKENQRYLLLDPVGRQVQTQKDATELFTICVENAVNLILIHGERLSDDFFRLQTGVAGIVMQKFIQYSIKAAIVIDEDRVVGRFKELLIESNKGNDFRSFDNALAAQSWLLSNNK